MKVLQNRLTNEELHTFLNEARVFRLKHPNIVSILDFGVERKTGTPFLILDYIPNGTLRQRHPRGTVVPLATLIQYIKDITGALQYAHEEHLIHRAIKPENLLIGQQGEILLSEFGIVTISQSGHLSPQSAQEIVGTPYYMAPEQFLGKPSRASDHYALAIIVYEWPSGDYPFNGTFAALAHQHLHTLPPPLHRKISMISPEVEQVVLKALEKDPKNRFDSVQTFATALEEASKKEWAFFQTPTVKKKTKEQWFKEEALYFEAGQYKDAIAAYTRVIELDPLHALAYYSRGTAYYHLKEYRQAIADYDRAIELDPRYIDAYNNRGVAYAHLKEYRKAIQDYDRLLKLDPKLAEVQAHREKAYRLLQGQK